MNILVTGANGQLGMEMRNVSSGSSDHYILQMLQNLTSPMIVQWSG